MKPCIYLTTNKQTGKWYIGSHKDSDNIRNRTYMGSGTSIAPELEANPDNFDCEVLFEFNTRDDAFKGEHQLLQALDAAGDENSYNNTNDSWPKEGFFKRLFGSKKGPLSDADIERIVSRITKGEALEGDKGGDSFPYHAGLRNHLENGSEQAFNKGFIIGSTYGMAYHVDKQLDIEKTRLVLEIEKEITMREMKINQVKKVIEKSTDNLAFQTRLKKYEDNIEAFRGRLKEIEDETGWYALYKLKYEEGVDAGVLIYIRNKSDLLNTPL